MKIENGITTIYAYRGPNVLYEKILENNTVTKYVYGAGKIVAKIRGGTTTYFHQDHLGSVRLVTDSTGASVFTRNYRPYGPELSGGTGVQDYKYTAKPQDPQTGLYYFGARYYDPELGRFITRDPLRGSLRAPQSLNPYSYALNNPLRFIDPNGLAA